MCWCHLDEVYVHEQRTAAAVLHSYGYCDNTWNTDYDVTDHIIGELDKLIMQEAYTSSDQIHAVNAGRYGDIPCWFFYYSHPFPNLVLNNVIHVPMAKKKLISVYMFTLDNDMFIEFYLFYFLIKYQKTRKVLLHMPCKGSLYPLTSSAFKLRNLIFSVTRFLKIGIVI
jgi:hypothetical protein